MKKNIISCIMIGSLITTTALAGQFVIKNNLPVSPGCSDGNTVTVFTGQSQPTIQPGASTTVTGDFSKMPGLGIQVNNWYWIQTSAPPQTSPQNPDNSGAQFTIDKSCAVTGQAAPWSGKGIQTYLIANVSAAMSNGTCTVTISSNNYTNAVTPNCCAPPIFQSNVCTGPYGVTNTGQSWPPS